jgi:hypothetical protein
LIEYCCKLSELIQLLQKGIEGIIQTLHFYPEKVLSRVRKDKRGYKDDKSM